MTQSPTLWAWGLNELGQLGDGTLTDRLVPVISGPSNPLSIAAAGPASHAFAIKSDLNRTMTGWGVNSAQQLARESPPNLFNAPIDITGINHSKAVGTGANHSIFLYDDLSVLSWGDNAFHQLGRTLPQFQAFDHVPTAVKTGPDGLDNLANIVALGIGSHHNLALAVDGSVWAWGTNFYGESGFPNSTTTIEFAQRIPTMQCNAVAAGQGFSLCLSPTGNVKAWGHNDSGQRGTTGIAEGEQPNWVLATDGESVADLHNVIAIAAGNRHALALLADGSVWGWGENDHGQVGQSESEDCNGTPCVVIAKRVPGIGGADPGAIAIAAGGSHSLALLSNGRVVSWGWNTNGQLGDGSSGNQRSTPGLVQNLFGVRQIAAGYRSSFAITGTITTDLQLNVTDTATTPIGRRGVATPGTTINYALTVTNAGSVAVPFFRVRDTVPANAEFVSASVGCIGPAAGAVGEVSCTGGALGPLQSQTLNITMRTTSPSVTNTASVVQEDWIEEPVISNNTVTVVTTLGKKKK